MVGEARSITTAFNKKVSDCIILDTATDTLNALLIVLNAAGQMLSVSLG